MAARWEFAPGGGRALPLRGAGAVRALALSPCGRTLYVAADGALLAAPVERGAASDVTRQIAGAWRHLAVTAEAVYAASGCAVHRFANTLAGQTLIRDGLASVVAVAASADGAALLIALPAAVLQLRAGAPPGAPPACTFAAAANGGCVRAIALATSRLAVLQDDGVRIWALAPEATVLALLGTRADRIRTVAWAPGGGALFCGRAASVREWSPDARGAWLPRRRSAAGGLIAALASRRGSERSGAAVGDDTSVAAHDLAVAGAGVLLVWHLGAPPGAPTSTNLLAAGVPPATHVRALALSADGTRVFAALGENTAEVEVREFFLRPPARWSTRTHAGYPPGFRAAVRCLLCCLARAAAERGLRWESRARSAFAEGAAAALAAQLYGHYHHGGA